MFTQISMFTQILSQSVESYCRPQLTKYGKVADLTEVGSTEGDGYVWNGRAWIKDDSKDVKFTDKSGNTYIRDGATGIDVPVKPIGEPTALPTTDGGYVTEESYDTTGDNIPEIKFRYPGRIK